RAREHTGGQVKGKIAYMAPEQLQGGAVDRRADLYAVGAVLYEMLSGRRRVPAGVEGIEPVLRGSYPRVREVCPGLPDAVGEIVDRALALAPDDRFPSSASMRQAIEGLA